MEQCVETWKRLAELQREWMLDKFHVLYRSADFKYL